MSAERRFIVLDRDGTLIVEKHYLSDPDAVELIDAEVGAAALAHGLEPGGGGVRERGATPRTRDDDGLHASLLRAGSTWCR